MTTDSLTEKYETISIKFKVCLSQLIAKIAQTAKLKANQTLFDRTFFKFDLNFFDQKI